MLTNKFVRLPLKFFDWRTGYGFARGTDGRDVYLDRRRIRVPQVVAGEVFYSEPRDVDSIPKINTEGTPIVCELTEGPKGPQAVMWGFGPAFDEAIASIQPKAETTVAEPASAPAAVTLKGDLVPGKKAKSKGRRSKK